jgi:hypothetical protein
MLKSRYPKCETKGKLCNAVLKPVLIRESWTLTKGDEQKLRACKRKVLRKFYGPTREKEGWQIKYNYELFLCQLVNTATSSPADDVHHYVILPKLLSGCN